MKRTIIRLLAFCVVFVLTLGVGNRIMNRGHDNLTMEMAPATYPLISMVMDGVEYNRLHGYSAATDIAFQRDTVTVLGEARDTGFVVDAYGAEVEGISIQVRSADGSRLIEASAITDYYEAEGRIRGRIALKDLIARDKEYSLSISLALGGDRQVSYYTRILWSDSLHVAEKIAFCRDFHDRLYDREAARELTKYLESNSRLESNESFHKVNIHSSFRQITWGSLDPEQVGEASLRLTEIQSQTASFLMDYLVRTTEGNETTYYRVQEYYRLRYTADRIYLLDYERTMTQIPDSDRMCVNDKILLGIADVDTAMMESEDGNVVAFESTGRLFSYNVATNKLTVIFGFYDKENADERTMYGQHTIKILDVAEGGNVQFAVYGYMNRGRHEGEVGIQLYTYDSERNTIEELLYIPYGRTYAVLAAEMEKLLYLNREQKLYLTLGGAVYGIDLEERTYERLVEVKQDDGLQVSANHKIVVWPEGEDIYRSGALNIQNLASGTREVVKAPFGEVIRPLGFMDEDIIYGVARAQDVVEEHTGRTFFPMHTIGICNSSGELLKVYRQEGFYVTDCTVSANQIVLDRVRRLEDGSYEEAEQDQVMNNMEAEPGKNVVMAVDTERYERYVEIQLRKTVDSKFIKVLTPKEVVYEGGRRLSLQEGDVRGRYYVYGAYGIDGIFLSSASAVNLAYEGAGVVTDEKGSLIWLRGGRSGKNQIMAIKEAQVSPERSALAVCLDTMLAYEGVSRSTQYYLDRGDTVLDILERSLEGAAVLDLTGCSLDAVLYYVNRDIPVLALTEENGAVLLVGFNDSGVGLMDPASGTIYTKKNSEVTEWFEENGNRFITYRKAGDGS